jgi:hypothetical protein
MKMGQATHFTGVTSHFSGHESVHTFWAKIILPVRISPAYLLLLKTIIQIGYL